MPSFHRSRYLTHICKTPLLVCHMNKQSTSTNPHQGSFAESFAGDQLYRNDIHLQEIPVETRYFPAKGSAPAREVNCIVVQKTPAVESLMGLDTVPFCNDQTNPDSTPYVQRALFYSDKIVVYPEMLPDRSGNYPQRGKIDNLSRGRYNGYISRSAGIKIRKRLEPWIKSVYMNAATAKGGIRPKHTHIGFLTLTLPARQIHDDNTIKRKILTPFLQQLKRINGVEQYFYSCEPNKIQDIHFHLLIDRWVDKDAVNDLWNIATDHLGYYSRYVATTGDIRPPSTKIMSCPDNLSLISYVMKYVSKQPEIRLSCYPADHRRKEGGAIRSDWRVATESIGEGGVLVKAKPNQVRKVVSCSYWTKEELKGGLQEANEKGLQILGDQVLVDKGRVFEYYERRPIQGRSWGMSNELKSVTVHSSYCSYRVYDLLSVLKWDPSVKITEGHYHEVYHCNVYDKLMRLDPVLLSDYRTHYLKTYRQLYDPPAIEEPVIEVMPYAVELRLQDQPKYRWKQLRVAI